VSTKEFQPLKSALLYCEKLYLYNHENSFTYFYSLYIASIIYFAVAVDAENPLPSHLPAVDSPEAEIFKEDMNNHYIKTLEMNMTQAVTPESFHNGGRNVQFLFVLYFLSFLSNQTLASITEQDIKELYKVAKGAGKESEFKKIIEARFDKKIKWDSIESIKGGGESSFFSLTTGLFITVPFLLSPFL
jgi:hypothetical protein